MNVKIANKLYELRKKKGLSQEELADKLGVSRQSVSKWERAEASPDTDNLILLSKIYGVSLDQIISEEDIEEAEQPKPEEKVIKFHQRPKTKADLVVEGISAVLYLLAVIGFLVIGFTKGIWHPTWVLFLVAIVVESVVKAIRKKKISQFNYPVLVTAVYIFLSSEFGLWHPLWVIFITIPVYYSILKIFRKPNDGDTVIDVDDEDTNIVVNCCDDDDDDYKSIEITKEGIKIKK